MEDLIRDFRHAVRQLVKAPGFTFVCIITLALGIGANTAIFSVTNAVLLRYLPVPNPQQLVYFHLDNQPRGTSQTGYNDTSFSLPVYEAMRTQRRIFSDVMAMVPVAWGKAAVRFGPQPEEAYGEMVSGNFFSGLGVRLFFGRGFTREDETAHSPLVILSYNWWTRRFAQDRSILGKTLYVSGLPFSIVGIAPRGFDGADPEKPMDFWIPLQARPDLNAWGMPSSVQTLYGSPNWLCLLLVGRLQPGVTQRQAISQLTPVFQRALYSAVKHIDPTEPKARLFFSSARGIEDLRADYQHPLTFLMAMVFVVLVIACANVALMLTARNANRRREFGVRMALGASRLQIFRQLLMEGVLLAGVGAAVGWLFSSWVTQALTAWSGLDVMVYPDRKVLLVTLVLALASALAFGLAPIRTATTVPMSVAMKASAATSNTDRTQYFGRRLVVMLQITLCFVLLVAAGLLFGSLRNLQSRNLGMRTDGLLLFGLNPQKDIRSDADAILFHKAILDRIRSLPGVESATVLQNRIGAGVSNNNGVLVDGRNPQPGKPIAPMRDNEVGPGFLHVSGIPLLLGRDISESDTASSQKVVVVNKTFADRYLPHSDPLGHHVAFLDDPKTQYAIVGVAQNSRYTGIREPDRPMAYFPYTQVPAVREMQYEVRSFADPTSLVPEIARVVRAFDPDVPMQKPITQQAQFDESVSQERLTANLSTFFGLLSALLVAIGLYGTLAYSVSRRTVEIGVRMALGAKRAQILWMILRESLWAAAIGIGLAVPIAALVARALGSMLYGLSPLDPAAFALALLGITAVALISQLHSGPPRCLRRSSKIPPRRVIETAHYP